MGRGRKILGLGCVVAAAAGAGFLFWPTSPPDHARPPAAVGPTGGTGPTNLSLVDFRANPQTLRNEAAAKRDVARLLGLVRLPHVSRSVRLNVAADPLPMAIVRGVQTWKVHLPVARVFAFEKAHQPRGSSFDGPSWGTSLIGGREMRDPGLMFEYPSGNLSLDIQALPGGWTRVRVDVLEYWKIARSTSEKLPAGVHEIVIHGPPRVAGRITSPARVARIVRWLDSVPVVSGVPGYCGPGLSGGDFRHVRIAFLGTGEKALASARFYMQLGDDGECNPITFRVRGRAEWPLDGGGTPIDRIERLLR